MNTNTPEPKPLLRIELAAENYAARIAMSYSGAASDRLLDWLHEQLMEMANAPRVERAARLVKSKRRRVTVIHVGARSADPRSAHESRV